MHQQQRQGQFMFSNFPPFLNNVPIYEQQPSNIPSNGHYIVRQNNNHSSEQYQWQSIYSEGGERSGENNKISYQRNRNQQQYALYPSNSIYRSTSGPGWQQQQVFYPANSFK